MGNPAWQNEISELRELMTRGLDRLRALELLLHSGQGAETPTRGILMADDDPIQRKVVSRMLESLGYTCTAVASGQEALDQVAEGGFEVLLLDVDMPEMGGLETARRIRAAHHPGPYIIALTAGSAASDRRSVMTAGMQDYLTKPLRLQELKDALEQSPCRGQEL